MKEAKVVSGSKKRNTTHPQEKTGKHECCNIYAVDVIVRQSCSTVFA